jgi:hypothetical protein
MGISREVGATSSSGTRTARDLSRAVLIKPSLRAVRRRSDVNYFFSGAIAWNVGLLKTLSRQAPLSCSLALPTE